MPAKAADSDPPAIYPINKPLRPDEDGDFACELTDEDGGSQIAEKLDDLRSFEPLSPGWKPVRVVFESCPMNDDFYRYCVGAFAVSQRARQVIERLAGDRVEFLPLKVVGIREDEDGPVRKLPHSEQRELFAVRPLEPAPLSAAAKFEDLGIMLLVHRYAFDWDTMEGRHWFRVSGGLTTMVSAELRAVIEQAGLIGFTFDKPIKYVIGAQAHSAPRKRVAPVLRPAWPDGTQLKARAAVWKS